MTSDVSVGAGLGNLDSYMQVGSGQNMVLPL